MAPPQTEQLAGRADNLADITNSKDQHTAGTCLTTLAGQSKNQPVDAACSTARLQVMPREAEAQLSQFRHGKDLTAAAAQEEITPSLDEPVPEYFERVPGSWLHQCIKSAMGPVDKYALFSTSSWLAKRVLETVPEVTLCLAGKVDEAPTSSSSDLEQLQPMTAEQVKVRRRIITKLLSVRKEFGVQVQPAPWQPFPTALANRVTSLTFTNCLTHGAISCVQWAALTNLQYLCFGRSQLCEEDIEAFCDAVEAGHLQHLRSLCIGLEDEPMRFPWAAHNDINDRLGRLARVLGLQLEELTAAQGALLVHIEHLAALRHLTLVRCRVTKGVMQQLCEHPTLKHLTLDNFWVDGDQSYRKCSWDTVTLVGHPSFRISMPVFLVSFARLPLAGVQQARILGAVVGQGLSCTQAFRGAIDMLGDKIICQPKEPGNPCSVLQYPCETMAPLLRRMQGVSTLSIEHVEGNFDIALFWQALPVSVKHIKFHAVEGYDWAQVWQGPPQHVVGIELSTCRMTTAELCKLVRTTPSHVTCMRVHGWIHSTSCVRSMSVHDWDYSTYAACMADNVQAVTTVVPLHLHFTLD